MERDKIIRGLDLYIQKLLTEKRKNDDELVIVSHHKITKIKAADL